MKPIRKAAISVFIGAALLLPTAVQAHWLRPAHPFEPLAFTWPAVRDVSDRVHVRRARFVKRHHLPRQTYVQRRHYGHAHVSSARSYRVSEIVYGYPFTGWKPLPYEFGPWDAAVVVLRH